MKKAIIGKKIGMTQIFDETGKVIPVTAIEAGPCVIAQIKTVETDGYDAVQLGFGDVKINKVNKPVKGHYEKANITPKKHLREFRLDSLEGLKVGDELKADVFAVGDSVDIQGTSKGKGFQGVIKRHGQSIGPKGHGSGAHRIVGSMGPIAPNRIAPGKKLPGQMGNVTRTVQNLEIVAVDVENNVLLISGSIPGPKKGLVVVKSAIKANGKVNPAEDLIIYETEEEIVENPVEEAVDTAAAE